MFFKGKFFKNQSIVFLTEFNVYRIFLAILIICVHILISDKGAVEIRGTGSGQTILLDLHHGVYSRHM